MEKLVFSYRDIGNAPRLAWSVRKMYISFRGIVLAWGIYIVFTYIALMFTQIRSEVGIVNLFRYFEFFPCLLTTSPGFLSWSIWIIGILISSCVLLLTATSVARIAFEDLRGNDIFHAKEALQFSGSQRFPIILSLIILCFMSLLFPISFSLTGILGRIPVLGELGVAFFSFPLFFWSLLGFFVFIVFIFGIALIPAIIACTGEDILEIIIQTFSSVFTQPLRLIVYEGVAKAVMFFCAFIIAVVSFLAIHSMNVTIGLLMGYKYSEMLTIALYRLPYIMDSPPLVSTIIGLGELLVIPYIVDTVSVSPVIQVSGWILGISLLLIFTWLVSYLFSMFYSSQVLIYLAVRKHKNGDDLRQKYQIKPIITESPAQ